MSLFACDLIGNRSIDDLERIWLTTEFEAGRHERRIGKIAEIEKWNNSLIAPVSVHLPKRITHGRGIPRMFTLTNLSDCYSPPPLPPPHPPPSARGNRLNVNVLPARRFSTTVRDAERSGETQVNLSLV